MKVFVAIYEHRHGRDIRIFTDAAGPELWRHSVAKQWWDKEIEEPMPPDEKLADHYFEIMGERRGESFSVEECEIETPIVVGKTYVYRYPPEFTSLPDHTAHSGQVVTVVRSLTEDEYDNEGDPMFKIRAADGWEGDAWASELEGRVSDVEEPS